MNKMNEPPTLPSKDLNIIFSTLPRLRFRGSIVIKPEAEGASVEAKATKTMDKARCGKFIQTCDMIR